MDTTACTTAIVRLGFGLPVTEHAKLSHAAAQSGVTLSAYIRAALRRMTEPVEVPPPPPFVIHNPERSGLLLIGARPPRDCAPHAVVGPQTEARLRRLIGDVHYATANVLGSHAAPLVGSAAKQRGMKALRAVLADLDVTAMVVLGDDAARLLGVTSPLMEWTTETRWGASLDVARAPHPRFAFDGDATWWTENHERASAFYAGLRERAA